MVQKTSRLIEWPPWQTVDTTLFARAPRTLSERDISGALHLFNGRICHQLSLSANVIRGFAAGRGSSLVKVEIAPSSGAVQVKRCPGPGHEEVLGVAMGDRSDRNAGSIRQAKRKMSKGR